MNPELTLLYVHSKHIGYGRYGEYLSETLASQGVTVTDDQGGPHDTRAAHLQSGAPGSITNVVCWVSVPTHARGWWAGQVPVISTMWESSILPESFRDTLHEFETVIVPSWHNEKLFSEFHPNVKYVPLGVDPERWHYVPRKAPSNEFRFLIGGSGSRKGVDLAVKAFKTVFRTPPAGGPRPVLMLKNPRGEDYYGDNIEMISGRLSAAAEVNLYEQAHCYLQPSRGEGFGLQPLQAIAQGIPTILTNAHGHESFAQLGIPIGYTMSESDYFIYGDAGQWWEPNFEELCEAMFDVYSNYEKAAWSARVSSSVVAHGWTWERTAEKFVKAIGADKLTTPYQGSGEWYQPTARLFPVVTTRDYYGEIAGRQLFYAEGKTYYEVADIKRILFEGGVLHPDCLRDNDLGLAPDQVAQLGLYRAEKEFCPTCRQRMNSQPTKADEILADMDVQRPGNYVTAKDIIENVVTYDKIRAGEIRA